MNTLIARVPRRVTHGQSADVVLRPLELSDRGLFARALANQDEPVSDASFTATYCWAQSLELRIVRLAGHLCLFSSTDGDLTMMLPPLSIDPDDASRLDEAVGAAFAIMDTYNATRHGEGRSRIQYVSKVMADRIMATGLEGLVCEAMPGDYVYRRSDLVELAGGDLKNKRKLRSRFLREHPDVTTGPITRGDVDACIGLLGQWRASADVRHEGEANEELMGVDVLRARDELSTIRYLETIETFGLESMLVRSAGVLVGFTIGEWLTPTMGVVSVEKTMPGVVGAPQFIYSEFCRLCFEGAEEINACDDWGISSLRYTKSSYRPSRMLEKFAITRGPSPETGVVEPSVVRALTHRRKALKTSEREALSATTVRRATIEDAGAISLVENTAFADERDCFSSNQIRRLIRNPRARVGVAEVDGVIRGWCVVLIRTHLRWRSGRVYSVAVQPEFAGRGLGRALLNWSLRSLADDGVERIYLEVRSANESAIHLYVSEGFEPIAELPNYYAEGINGIRMRRVTGASTRNDPAK